MEEKLIDSNLKAIEKLIYTFPIALLSYPSLRKSIDNYLPYSHGMEFECIQQESYDRTYFDEIPNIMAVQVDTSEQRYRIPSGLNGMICLWNICEAMRKHSIVDLKSSNHYHTDMTDVAEITHTDYNRSNNLNDFQISNHEWIIEELKTWKTAINVSSGWYYYNSLGTLEIRIGEPTFDYTTIITRLIQCARIVTKLKRQVLLSNPRLYKLEALLKGLGEDVKIEQDSEETIKEIINSRTIKI